MFAEEIPGKKNRLLKALYGLKQSPQIFTSTRLSPTSAFTADFCVYAIHEGPDRVLLGLFVDDIFIIGHSVNKIGDVKSFFSQSI